MRLLAFTLIWYQYKRPDFVYKIQTLLFIKSKLNNLLKTLQDVELFSAYCFSTLGDFVFRPNYIDTIILETLK